MRTIRRFLSDETAGAAVEYGLILSLVGVAGIAGYETIRAKLTAAFDDLAARLGEASDFRRIPRRH